MNWRDERYVRVYTKDTADWLALRWEAKACLPLMLRKCDRAGIVAVKPGPQRLRLLAGLIGIPLEIVTPAVEDLMADGCLVEREVGFVFPNYIEAQEAEASDAKRAREYRERVRDKAMQDVTPAPTGGDAVTKRDPPSRNVTKTEAESIRDEPSQDVGEGERTVTKRDDAVTSRDEPSQSGVTKTSRLAVPAVPPDREANKRPSEFSNPPSLSEGGDEIREGGREFSLWANKIRTDGGLSFAPDGKDFEQRYVEARLEATDEELREAFEDFIGTYEHPGWGLAKDPVTKKPRDASLALFFSETGDVWRSRVASKRGRKGPVAMETRSKPVVPIRRSR